MHLQKFSFSTIKDFDNHISKSIYGYDILHNLILNISSFFKEATEEFWGSGGESIERFAIYKQWKEINYPKETSHIKRFSLVRPFLDKPSNTLTEGASNNSTASVCHPLQPRKLNKYEASVLQSYPLDYNFLDQNPLSCIGRSVPPIMTAQVANQIRIQWLDNLK